MPNPREPFGAQKPPSFGFGVGVSPLDLHVRPALWANGRRKPAGFCAVPAGSRRPVFVLYQPAYAGRSPFILHPSSIEGMSPNPAATASPSAFSHGSRDARNLTRPRAGPDAEPDCNLAVRRRPVNDDTLSRRKWDGPARPNGCEFDACVRSPAGRSTTYNGVIAPSHQHV